MRKAPAAPPPEVTSPCGFAVEECGTYSPSAYQCFSAADTAELLGWTLEELELAESYGEIRSHGSRSGLRYTSIAIDYARAWLGNLSPADRAAYRARIDSDRETRHRSSVAKRAATRAAVGEDSP